MSVRPTLIYDLGVCDRCSRVVVFKKNVGNPLCPNCDVNQYGQRPGSQDLPPEVKRAVEDAMRSNPDLAKMMEESFRGR